MFPINISNKASTLLTTTAASYRAAAAVIIIIIIITDVQPASRLLEEVVSSLRDKHGLL